MRLARLITGALLTATFGLPQGINNGRMPDNVAVFAVRQEEQLHLLDPIVIVHYGADQRFRTVPSLNPPMPEQRTAEDFEDFENTFYKIGARVSIFLGGERLGDARIIERNSEGRDGGCSVLSSTISYVSGQVPLLASNTTTEIPSHRSSRRPASPEETARLRQLARDWLSEYGIDRELLQHGEMGPVISTQLRGNGGSALIGRFDVKSKRSIHRLFAVAEPEGPRYRLTLTNLEIQLDLEDGTDRAEVGYLDQLDINNDGVDEVLTSIEYYESWRYSVWQFFVAQGLWTRSYTGGGGGC